MCVIEKEIMMTMSTQGNQKKKIEREREKEIEIERVYVEEYNTFLLCVKVIME